MLTYVINRDGIRMKFDVSRIEMAIEKALHACTGKDEKISEMLSSKGFTIPSLSTYLANEVVKKLEAFFGNFKDTNRYLTVELIQDYVEQELMQQGFFFTAKSYILYREAHAQQRRKIFTLAKYEVANEIRTVSKRDGSNQAFSKYKVYKRVRIEVEREPALTSIDPSLLVEKVIRGLHDEVTTVDIDTLCINTAKDLILKHPEYNNLSARLAISRHHKDTDLTKSSITFGAKTQFGFAMSCMWNNIDQNSDPAPLLKSQEFYDFIMAHEEEIDKVIDYDRDYRFDIFGFETLAKTYLMKALYGDSLRKIVERPQDMWMRVALGIHCIRPNEWKNFIQNPSEYEIKHGQYIDDKDLATELMLKRDTFKPDLESAFYTYNCMSRGFFTHATPTLIYAGTRKPCLSSCYLIAMNDDSIDGIYKTLSDCAKISKHAGGIGFHLHKIRAQQSYIRGTAGESNGIVPMMRVYNETARYVDQGGGKRKGAFAAYLSCNHADIEDFIQLKSPFGLDHRRCRDLFYCFWRNDYFMECVIEDRDWYLMCPDQSPGLEHVHGEDYVELYERYVREGKYRKKIKARDLYRQVLVARTESGGYFIGEKDSINAKSNQSNLGTIQSSNLCTEITLYSDPQEIAVCNLNSIALPMFVVEDKEGGKHIDHENLHYVAFMATRNLNKVIDRNFYPTPETERSNYRHRPVGVGVQGLADVYFKMKIPYDSEEAIKLDAEIFETIYHGAATASWQLAREEGPYSTFKFGEGSPLSHGKFQFDLWGDETQHSGRWDWDDLRERIMEDGIRNSELIAPMPTASTSQILGNTETIEPIKSNVYKRKTSSGEFIVRNKYLNQDIIDLGLDVDEVWAKIELDDGSVQNIDEIPDDLKAVYKTAWEINQKSLIDHCAARSHYVTQSCSLNLYFPKVEPEILMEVDIYAWMKGLKTQYYTHTRSATKAKQHHREPKSETTQVCTMEEDCVMCSS
jgi:ribonucleoside-diphosphate reductase alpha chain